MEFEIIDNYTQETIVDLVGVGKYGKNVANYIKHKEITGLDCKESVSDTHNFDLIFVNASLEELERISEEDYSPPKNLKSYETISYLYVKTNICIDFCNDRQLKELQDHFDVIIPITNKPDDVESIYWSIRGITELITTAGMICVDFADVLTTSKKMGIGATSHGLATGSDKYVAAARKALELFLNSEINTKNAKAIIVAIIADIDIAIGDFDKVGEMVRNIASDEVDVLVGPPISITDGHDICVSIIANGVCGI